MPALRLRVRVRLVGARAADVLGVPRQVERVPLAVGVAVPLVALPDQRGHVFLELPLRRALVCTAAAALFLIGPPYLLHLLVFPPLRLRRQVLVHRLPLALGALQVRVAPEVHHEPLRPLLVCRALHRQAQSFPLGALFRRVAALAVLVAALVVVAPGGQPHRLPRERVPLAVPLAVARALHHDRDDLVGLGLARLGVPPVSYRADCRSRRVTRGQHQQEPPDPTTTAFFFIFLFFFCLETHLWCPRGTTRRAARRPCGGAGRTGRACTWCCGGWGRRTRA